MRRTCLCLLALASICLAAPKASKGPKAPKNPPAPSGPRADLSGAQSWAIQLIGPGTGNNLVTHQTVKVTINANGEATADVNIDNIDCK